MMVMRFGLLVAAALALGCSRSKPAEMAPRDEGPAPLVQRALQHKARGASLEAEQFLVAAWDAGAPTEQVLPALLEVCFRAGRLESLKSHLDRARQLEPEDAYLPYLGAEILYALGDSPGALAEVSALIERLEAPPRAYLLRGMLLVKLGADPEEASLALQEYLRREPGGPEAKRVRSLLEESNHD
jgi:tetratricopeptide (TPR) repeat protein